MAYYILPVYAGNAQSDPVPCKSNLGEVVLVVAVAPLLHQLWLTNKHRVQHVRHGMKWHIAMFMFSCLHTHKAKRVRQSQGPPRRGGWQVSRAGILSGRGLSTAPSLHIPARHSTPYSVWILTIWPKFDFHLTSIWLSHLTSRFPKAS